MPGGMIARGSPRLRPRCRQGVPAAGLGHLLGDGETHERAPDVGLGVPVGEGGEDDAPGAGHAIAEQGQHVGRDPRDDGVEVGGGPSLGGWHAGPGRRWSGQR
jgi:hypothetical protein